MYENISININTICHILRCRKMRDDAAGATDRATRRRAFASGGAARQAAPKALAGAGVGCTKRDGPRDDAGYISAFEYISGNVQKMFAANANKLYERDVRQYADAGEGRTTSGNYSTSARHR